MEIFLTRFDHRQKRESIRVRLDAAKPIASDQRDITTITYKPGERPLENILKAKLRANKANYIRDLKQAHDTGYLSIMYELCIMSHVEFKSPKDVSTCGRMI